MVAIPVSAVAYEWSYNKEFCLEFLNAFIYAGGANINKSFWTNQVKASARQAMKIYGGKL